MNKLLCTLVIALVSCSSTVNCNEVVEVYDEFADLEELLAVHDDKVVVINFWATSCGPCIKEMPHFNELEAEQNEDVKIVLVSLDEPKYLDNRVYPFVKKHELKPEVVLLGDENYSAWTAKIDESWFGALPATLVSKGDKRIFRFGAYESFEELAADIETVKGVK